MVPECDVNPPREETPTVSIILTTHNRRDLVVRAIGSVQAQTFKDWELIVIDDGSSDGTAEAVMRLAHDDRRIRYHFWANRGLAASRNWGIAVARGTFVTFLDDDDEYMPDHVGRRVAHLAVSTAVDMVTGGLRVIGPEGSDKVPDMNDRTRMIPISQCQVGGTFFARTDALRAVGGFRDIYGMDQDLHQRFLAHGFMTETISNPTYLYHRDSEDSMCNQAKLSRAEVESEMEIGI
ncbi:glycosyltransferase family 2 protein [Candidatus Sumerlaeota bacterium]|nr:glycosyltransferase family 2 protein [Candidatus Sumerlaeota bacterium]